MPRSQSPPAPAIHERPISVYDQHGRKIEVGREAWRKDVLLPNLAANRDRPDTLHGLISDALRDDFAADVLDHARHLADTDPQPRRGALLLGTVLLQLKDFAAARAVFERALGRHGDDAYLLSGLARALAELGDAQGADELIWRALALDPNEEAALGWLAARAEANGGPVAVLAIYARAAMLSGSWRAHLALARAALGRGDTLEAGRLYEEALNRVIPPHEDLLTQMSADLGNRGQSELLVRLTRPHFDAAVHGLVVGSNLLRALIDLGRLAEARKLLEQLQARQRPEWLEQLLGWERKLDDAQKTFVEAAAPSDFIVLTLEQPVWASEALGFDTVLPRKVEGAPRIHIFCASGEGPPAAAKDLGRITRALPMFFAEELYLRSSAKCAFLLPWRKQGGFIVSAQPWSRELLPADPSPPELLVFMHIDATRSPWRARVTLAQPEAGAISFAHNIAPGNLAQGAVALLEDLATRATILLGVQRKEGDPALATPRNSLLPAYLTALEYALVVEMAARRDAGDSLQIEERAIFDHLLDVATKGGRQLRPRMLLMNALENQSRRRPGIVAEYFDGARMLNERHTSGAGAEVMEKAVATIADKTGAAR